MISPKPNQSGEAKLLRLILQIRCFQQKTSEQPFGVYFVNVKDINVRKENKKSWRNEEEAYI